MDVGSADATGADLDNDIVRSGFRFWDVDDPHLPGSSTMTAFMTHLQCRLLATTLDISFQRDGGKR